MNIEHLQSVLMMSQPSPVQGYKKNPLIFNKKNYFSNVFKEACRLHCSPEQHILVINLCNGKVSSYTCTLVQEKRKGLYNH